MPQHRQKYARERLETQVCRHPATLHTNLKPPRDDTAPGQPFDYQWWRHGPASQNKQQWGRHHESNRWVYLEGPVEGRAENVATLWGELDIPHLLPVQTNVLGVSKIREAQLKKKTTVVEGRG